MLRDGQKWVALAVPGYAVAGAGAVVTLAAADSAGRHGSGLLLALLAVLPDLAWGVGGKMTSVRYPPGWTAVAAMINADPRPVAVLPADSMRAFDWAGAAPVLDPLPRWVSADVLTTGDLVIGGRRCRARARMPASVQRLLLAGADCRRAGASGRRLGGRRIWDGPQRLRTLPAAYQDDGHDAVPHRRRPPAASHRGLLIAAHLVWLAALSIGGTARSGAPPTVAAQTQRR